MTDGAWIEFSAVCARLKGDYSPSPSRPRAKRITCRIGDKEHVQIWNPETEAYEWLATTTTKTEASRKR